MQKKTQTEILADALECCFQNGRAFGDRADLISDMMMYWSAYYEGGYANDEPNKIVVDEFVDGLIKGNKLIKDEHGWYSDYVA